MLVLQVPVLTKMKVIKIVLLIMLVMKVVVIIVLIIMEIYVVVLHIVRKLLIIQIQMILPKICLNMNTSVRVCSLAGKMTATWNWWLNRKKGHTLTQIL